MSNSLIFRAGVQKILLYKLQVVVVEAQQQQQQGQGQEMTMTTPKRLVAVSPLYFRQCYWLLIIIINDNNGTN